MLCAGVIHGDLSEFNMLVDSDGPVIIDLPQAVDAAGNNHAGADAGARRGQSAHLLRPLRARAAGHQVRQGNLGAVRGGDTAPRPSSSPDASSGASKAVDLDSVLSEIEDARFEEAEKRRRLQAVE